MPQAGFEFPSALRAAGYSLRPQREEDYAFLERLYFSVRLPEVEAMGWPQETRNAFLAGQCRMQHAHYQTHYWDAEFLILERGGKPVGRIYLFRGPRDHRIVDISLLPEVRGGGVGGALLKAVQDEAAAAGKSVSIHVEKFNPAQNLYRRLGFREAGEKGPYWLMEWQPQMPGSAGGTITAS
jgi:ribosomal protein S18 acetylase RimI-like enzyme